MIDNDSGKNYKILGAFSYTFNTKPIDNIIVESAKRWLDIKKSEHRNYCPFILKNASCKDICGSIIESSILDENTCPRDILTSYAFYDIVEYIVHLYNKD